MNVPRTLPVVLASMLALGYVGVRQVATAANTVPASRAGAEVLLVDATELAPSECRGLNLRVVVRGAGLVGGTTGNDLILGGPGPDELQGRTGDDCIVGGDGDDHIDGGGGHDVCIGGPGNDVFHNCAVVIQ
jgi:hypothetical protein